MFVAAQGGDFQIDGDERNRMRRFAASSWRSLRNVGEMTKLLNDYHPLELFRTTLPSPPGCRRNTELYVKVNRRHRKDAAKKQRERASAQRRTWMTASRRDRRLQPGGLVTQTLCSRISLKKVEYLCGTAPRKPKLNTPREARSPDT